MWGISEKLRLGLRLLLLISLVEALKANADSLTTMLFGGEEARAMLSLEDAFVGDPSPEEGGWLLRVPRGRSGVGGERVMLDVGNEVRDVIRRLFGVPGPD